MTWDIRASVEYNYNEDIAEFRQAFGDPGPLSWPATGHETVVLRT